ncbi:MAG: hypothetical protein FWD04_12080 [Conexibacteraceae bacterium]|nr:hypothetical protein [Conexibacteraceae bacterium]
MNSQLMYLIAQQHNADLQHAAERARLANEARHARRTMRKSNQITGLSARAGRGSPPGMTATEFEPVIASKR